MMITIILHKLDPICRPLYVDGSVALPFEAPFQRAINLECPHDVGTVWVFQMSDSRLSISVDSLTDVVAYLKNTAGRSFNSLPFFRFNRVDLISSFVGDAVLMNSLLICCNTSIYSGVSLSSFGSFGTSFSSTAREKCPVKNSRSFSWSHLFFLLVDLKVEPSALKLLNRSSNSLVLQQSDLSHLLLVITWHCGACSHVS